MARTRKNPRVPAHVDAMLTEFIYTNRVDKHRTLERHGGPQSNVWRSGERVGAYGRFHMADDGLCDVMVDLEYREDALYINTMKTTDVKECQRKGYASEVLGLLTALADKYQVPLVLEASPFAHKTVSKANLVKFYQRYGFKKKRGSVWMIRKPGLAPHRVRRKNPPAGVNWSGAEDALGVTSYSMEYKGQGTGPYFGYYVLMSPDDFLSLTAPRTGSKLEGAKKLFRFIESDPTMPIGTPMLLTKEVAEDPELKEVYALAGIRSDPLHLKAYSHEGRGRAMYARKVGDAVLPVHIYVRSAETGTGKRLREFKSPKEYFLPIVGEEGSGRSFYSSRFQPQLVMVGKKKYRRSSYRSLPPILPRLADSTSFMYGAEYEEMLRTNPPLTSRHPMLLRHIVRGMFVQGSDPNATKTKAQIKKLVAMYGKYDLDPREELNLAFGTATNSLLDSGKIRKSKDDRRWVLTDKGKRASDKKRRDQGPAVMKRKDQQYEWILEFTRKGRR